MKKKLLSVLMTLVMILGVVPYATLSVGARYAGDYIIDVVDNCAVITGYEGAGGDLVIPATLSNNLPVVGIDYGVFIFNDSLTSVTLPDSLTYIGEAAFAYCSQITSVRLSSNLTDIGEAAFAGCMSLSSIDIPASVTSIGADAFSSCQFLSAVNVQNGNTAYTSDAGVLYNIDMSELMLYPSGKEDASYSVPFGVETIDDSAFSENPFITSVTLPDTVTTLGLGAFAGDESLSSVKLSNAITEIPMAAFTGCASLSNITLPAGLITIADMSFFASSLAEITIPNGVEYIGNSAFLATGLTSVFVPASVSEIGLNAFVTDYLTEIKVSPENTRFFDDNGVLYDDLEKKMVTYPYAKTGTSYSIIDGTELVAPVAFNANPMLQSVYIPDSVCEMGMNAFIYCSALTDVRISPNVKTIPAQCFEYCTSLVSITIPEGVETLSSFVFDGCEQLSEINVPETLSFVEAGALDNTAFVENSANYDSFGALYLGKCLVTAKNMGNTSITVKPGTVSISPQGLMLCSSLENINLPDSIERVGFDAFYDTAYYNNVNNWKDEALLYVGNVLVIADYSVLTCAIDYGTTVIADDAFAYSCLADIYIPDSVKYIGDSAFMSCDLASVEIPSSVTAIPDDAFSFCANLESVTLPAGLSEIKEGAFAYCDAFTTVYFNGNLGQWKNVSIDPESNEALLAADVICAAPCEHNVESYLPNNDATCTLDGTKTGVCTICGERVTVADEGTAKGHVWGENVLTTAPTKAHPGTFTKTCTVCGEYETSDAPFYIGDINDDMLVNGKDDNLLTSYINADSATINEEKADINEDGSVNGKDGNLMKQIVNGDYSPQ